MIQFEMFRVSGWLDEDGLLKRLEVATKDVIAGVKNAGSGAKALVAVGAFVAAAGIAPTQANASGVAWPPYLKAQEAALDQESAEARVARLDAAMADSISRLRSVDQSDLDPRVVAAAAEFLATMSLPRPVQ